MTRDIVVVHSSDLHIDDAYTARLHGGDGTAGLAAVLGAAARLHADAVVLAGDTFESHRLPAALLDDAAALIASAAMPIVLLPGNHDPLIADSVYHHTSLVGVTNLHVIGLRGHESVVLADLALEIWDGRIATIPI